VFLRNLLQRYEGTCTGICEYDVHVPLLLVDDREQSIKVSQVRYITLYRGHISSNHANCRIQCCLAAAGDET
jgi:hypothetical protein